MLKIFGADLSSPANKVRFVANVLNIEYEYIRVNLREGEHKKEKFLSMNPSGKIPCIDDEGFVLSESNAIIKYLADKEASDLYPKDIKKRAIVDQWMDYAVIHVGGAMNRVVFNRIFVPLLGLPLDEMSLKDGLNFLNRFLPVVEKRLEEETYLAGDAMSLADIVLLSVVDPCEVAEIDIQKYTCFSAWRTQLQKEEFYSKCHSAYGDVLERMKEGMKR